jgi:hypothetical protein
MNYRQWVRITKRLALVVTLLALAYGFWRG